MTEEKQLAVRESKTPSLAPRNFTEVAEAATRYSRSMLVPERFRGKPDDCFVAIQLAARQNVDPLMFMQHSYVVHGSPGIEGKYAIALMNAKGPFKGGVQFDYKGEGKTRECTAWALHRQTGARCEATVSMALVEAEGWAKNPKWRTMTDQMLAYRSGAFLCRRYCPEVMMGMQTVEELEDIIDITPEPVPVQVKVEGIPSDEFEGYLKDMEEAFERGEGPEWWVGNKAIRTECSEEQLQRLIERKNELKEHAGAPSADSASSPKAAATPVSSPVAGAPDDAPAPPESAGSDPDATTGTSPKKRGRPPKQSDDFHRAMQALDEAIAANSTNAFWDLAQDKASPWKLTDEELTALEAYQKGKK